jgi:ribosomal protein S19
MRSVWKFKFFNKNLVNFDVKKNKNFFFRNSIFSEILLKKRLSIHNGKWFKTRILNDKFAIGHKIGEFAKTRFYTKGNKVSKRTSKVSKKNKSKSINF